LRQLVRDGVLPASYATDDGAAVIYEDDRVVDVLADRANAHTYLVRREADGGLAETVIPARRADRAAR
jgi:hypothetical protein